MFLRRYVLDLALLVCWRLICQRDFKWCPCPRLLGCYKWAAAPKHLRERWKRIYK